MPIYEEKLISPLAVRFTQEHIRPQFQDGRDIEATITEIKTRPGVGDYDIIIEAPFPNIEIVRWYQQETRGTPDETKHWFTLDNRRLYCLQRVAASFWPKRVAIVVEGLYAATDGIWRKDDSSTGGLAVSIGHSLKMLTDHWNWQQIVASPEDANANELIRADDQKQKVADLVDAPAPPSMLDLFLQGADDGAAGGPVDTKKEAAAARGAAGVEDSTTGPSTPRSPSSPSSGGRTSPQTGLAVLRNLLVGRWEGEQGEAYDLKAKQDGSWVVLRNDEGGTKKFTLWYDEGSDSVWWGLNWSLYLDISQACRGQLRWMPGDAAGDRPKPRFVWHRPAARVYEDGARPPAAKAGPRRVQRRQRGTR